MKESVPENSPANEPVSLPAEELILAATRAEQIVHEEHMRDANQEQLAYTRIMSVKIETPEQAQELVRSHMSYLAASRGPSELSATRDALDFFMAEEQRARTTDIEHSTAVAKVFAEAIQVVEAMVEKMSPQETVINRKLEEAQRLIELEQFIHAVPILYEALKGKPYQKFWKDKEKDDEGEMRNKFESLLDTTKKSLQEQQRKKKEGLI